MASVRVDSFKTVVFFWLIGALIFLSGCSSHRTATFSINSDRILTEPETLATIPLYHSRKQEQRVSLIFRKLLGGAEHVTPIERVFLLDHSDWNAASYDTHTIYLFRGLLEDLKDDNQLAAVLSHELAHQLLILQGHSEHTEWEADCLSIQILNRAGFSLEGAISALAKAVEIESRRDLSAPTLIESDEQERDHPHPPSTVRKELLIAYVQKVQSIRSQSSHL